MTVVLARGRDGAPVFLRELERPALQPESERAGAAGTQPQWALAAERRAEPSLDTHAPSAARVSESPGTGQ